MNEKKHIDRLFQEKFKNFEATPDDAVWENIHRALHKDERKRRVVPFWWKMAGVAALLALLFTVGNAVFNKDNHLTTPNHNMVGTETNNSASEATKTTTRDENKNNSNNLVKENSNTIVHTTSEADPFNSKNTSTTHSTKIKNKRDNHNIALEDASKENPKATLKSQAGENTFPKEKTVNSNSREDGIVKNTLNQSPLNSNEEVIRQNNESAKTTLDSKKVTTEVAKVSDQNISKEKEKITPNQDLKTSNKEESIEDAIAKANPTNEEEKEEQPNRWNITPNVAPVYFNTLGKGSSIDGQFVNNNKTGEVNMSYGISGSYAINDKIKVRAGINKVDLGYSTDGIIAFNEMNSFSGKPGNAELRNINFKNQGAQNAYLSTSNINVNSAPQFLVSNADGALEQQFGYIEVPLELEYSIINTKFGLNVIGGFSTLFLNTNEIYSLIEGERLIVGEANNINSTSYSANFGLGFNYNISSMLKLNLEPMFKYQINTFTNTSGDFRPYFIGVYSGVSFKF